MKMKNENEKHVYMSHSLSRASPFGLFSPPTPG